MGATPPTLRLVQYNPEPAKMVTFFEKKCPRPGVARSEGLEPPTYKFVACCSIQLSYDRVLFERRGLYRALGQFPATRLARRDSEREGFEPSIRFNTYNGLANRRLQPLGHLSAARRRPLFFPS